MVHFDTHCPVVRRIVETFLEELPGAMFGQHLLCFKEMPMFS